MSRVPCFLFVTLLLHAAQPAQAAREFWYQKVWCEGKGGKVEHELPQGPRVDCLTKTHAIEMDFARKWPEAIGQSLHYSLLTGLEAGIVLILKSPGETHHIHAARKVIKHYQLPIKLWRLGP
ncbi:hypothetical protein M3P05_08815 [Sansalvadorimonas sp. 2012CJ34-2]|uniref:Uncharacterized protein n=1 Tax=Parendozoicomonas callyspongiae TaxID=2942213 RepID=A0ABT0PFM0_9GAMM|nr:hypothetical protein [Sansalvadorimonas sp. 2012CJ34-2]MCL6270031.1 hypothetical protein [Sansalvadorimonas sp. 2012CJ34-2]